MSPGSYIYRDEDAPKTNRASDTDQKNGIPVMVTSCIYNTESHISQETNEDYNATGLIQVSENVGNLHGIIHTVCLKLEETAQLWGNQNILNYCLWYINLYLLLKNAILI